MRFLKNVFSQLHSFVLWALLSAIFVGWIFTFVTDTSPEKKVEIYCYVPELRDTDLAVELERDMPEGLRMIRVHTFTYVMMNVDLVENGDIYILPESVIGEYEELLADRDAGIKVYDAAAGKGAASQYIGYEEEDYYLFIGANSPHLEDGKAQAVAEALMGISE